MSLFKRLKEGLRKSTARFGAPLVDLLTKEKLTPEDVETLEDLLIQADLGVPLALELTRILSQKRFHSEESPLDFLSDVLTDRLKAYEVPLVPEGSARPWVMVLLGVNGSGKTTTAGKLAAHWAGQGKRVGLVAGDTFRAAATAQLQVWADRAGAHLYQGSPGADSAALAFDALKDAKAQALDLLIIDTAGRLQNKAPLMAELSKIIRVLGREDPSVPQSCLLVLDATTGQNALSQAKVFGEAVPLTGVIVTKLDGTAKGGILFDVADTLGKPIPWIGVGEALEDLQPFEARPFACALLGRNDVE